MFIIDVKTYTVYTTTTNKRTYVILYNELP